MAGRFDIDHRGRIPIGAWLNEGPRFGWHISLVGHPSGYPCLEFFQEFVPNPGVRRTVDGSSGGRPPGVICAVGADNRVTLPRTYLRAGGFSSRLVVDSGGSLQQTAVDEAAYDVLWEGPPSRHVVIVPRTFESDDRPHPGCVTAVDWVSSRILDELTRDVSTVRDLSPRQFEVLVAELLADAGFTVVLTAPSSDNGVDVYALDHARFGVSLIVVDCKRYHAGLPVGVGLVRQINGTIWEQRADAGMLVTTSRFTRGARLLAAKYPGRIDLRDLDDLQTMVRESVEIRRRRRLYPRPHRRQGSPDG